MQLSMDYKSVLFTAVIIGGFYILTKKEIEKAIPGLKKIDPTSPSNIFYVKFTEAWKAISGSDEPLGADIADAVYKIKQWLGIVPSGEKPNISDIIETAQAAETGYYDQSNGDEPMPQDPDAWPYYDAEWIEETLEKIETGEDYD